MSDNCIMKVECIEIEHIDDTDPDFSYMGRYASEWAEGAIDRQERGDWKHGEYRYFIPAVAPGEPNYDKTISDADRTKYGEQDYKRFEDLMNGRWSYCGIMAKATVKFSKNGGQWWRLHCFTSGGLWGIESDADKDHIKGIERDELNDLIDVLKIFHVPETEITGAVDRFKQREK